jgi:hypothetical protein
MTPSKLPAGPDPGSVEGGRRHFALKRRENPNGQLWRATASKKLDKCMKVVAPVLCRPDRQRGRNARSDELVASPNEDVIGAAGSGRLRPHDLFVIPGLQHLPDLDPGLSASGGQRGSVRSGWLSGARRIGLPREVLGRPGVGLLWIPLGGYNDHRNR